MKIVHMFVRRHIHQKVVSYLEGVVQKCRTQLLDHDQDSNQTRVGLYFAITVAS